MSRMADMIWTGLVTVGLIAFFVLHGSQATTLMNGFVTNANSFTSNIATLGGTSG